MPKRATKYKQDIKMVSGIQPNPDRVINAENFTAEVSKTRIEIEAIIFRGVPPSDKFDRAARNSFMDCVMALMENGGRFIRL